MRWTDMVLAVGSLLQVRVFNKRVPLIVGWAVTYRCPNNCRYCGTGQETVKELDTDQALGLIDELALLGTKWLSLTGGEPLLRNDIGEIVGYARKKRIHVSINTSGVNVDRHRNVLEIVDMVKISLDGPKGNHDRIRGDGSFAQVLHTIALCQQHRIPVCLGCVLTGENLDAVEELLSLAEELRVKISFQPATENILRSAEVNSLAPEKEALRSAIEGLVRFKKAGRPVYNSLAGLRYLAHYPDYEHLNCYAGRLSFRLEPDGTLCACDRYRHPDFQEGVKRLPLSQQLAVVALPEKCGRCWCSSMTEANLMFQLNSDAITNFIFRKSI